jgi:serine/threonine protein kinase/Tol biopolymer transport system component
MIGKTVSHYRILEKLGEGGMGVVYKAEDTRLKRTVALKFLPYGLHSHEPERARFLQEAQAASALNHPNVCTIYDIAETEEQQFIAMEYVDGRTLRQMLPLRSLQAAVNYAIQIGEALHEAHSKGIVHRDVKTDNIMVNSKDQVKVMDFGLAKLKGSLKLTQTSSTVGTLAYMAPELIEGKEVDARSDIFSFGVVLYELLTGYLPFRGDHEAAMMYSIVNEEPEPLQRSLPDAPSELLHVVMRSLEKDPDERYQTVHDMVIDLRRLKRASARVVRPPEHHQEATAASSPGPRRWSRRRLALILGSTIGGLGAVIAVLLLARGPVVNPEMRSRVLQLPFRNVSYASMSKDGSWIVFPAADDRGRFDVYMMNVAQGQPRRITNDSCYHIFKASLSPDAGTILYSRRRSSPLDPHEIVSISSLGGTGRVVVENGYNEAWMSDGERFGYLREVRFGPAQTITQWWSCKADGSDRRCEIADTIIARQGVRVAYCYSPDGRSIAWTKNFPEGYSEVMIRDLASGADRQLTSDRQFADDPLWTETGHVFYSSNRGGNVNLWMVSADGGEPVQITRGGGPDSPLGMTADGKRLMYSEIQDIGQVKIGSITDGSVRQLTVDERQRGMAAISPTGRYVAFPAQEADVITTTRNIYLMDRDGGNLRRLTDDPLHKSSPHWSPDEKWITYHARRGTDPEDSSEVYLIQVDRPGQPRPMGRGMFPHWFSEREFVRYEPSSGTYTRASDHPGEVKISEDSLMAVPVLQGRFLATLDWHRGRAGWRISAAAGGSTGGPGNGRQLTTGLSFATIPPGSHDLFYVPPGSAELHHVSLPEGNDRALRTFPGLGTFFSVTRDGREIAYTETYRKMRFVLIENLFR